MIKYFYLLLALASISFSQTVGLFVDEDISEDASGYVDSDDVRFSDEFGEVGNWFGLLSFTLDLDSSTTIQGNDDSLIVKPMVKLNGNWYTGDTLQWDRFNTANIAATIIQTNHKWLLPSVLHDSLLVYIPDPTDTTNVWGLPSLDNFKLRAYYSGDSVDFNIDIRAGVH